MRHRLPATILFLAATFLYANPIPQFEFELANYEEDYRISGEPGDELGASLAAGRLHPGDLWHDLVIGAPGAGGGDGAVRVYFGEPDLNPAAPDLWITGDPALHGARLGTRVACGDVNGDGVDDLVIGCPLTTDGGRVYILYGDAALAGGIDLGASSPDCLVTGRTTSGRLGEALAVADVNGDGIDDLFLVDPSADPLGRAGAGAVFIIHGRADLPAEIHLATDAPDQVILGAAAGDSLAAAIAVGDIDGDGRADVVFGTPSAANGHLIDAGAARVIRGRPTVKDTVDLLVQTDVLFEGQRDRDHVGAAVAIADVDLDSIGDMLIGVPREVSDFSPVEGWVAVFHGRESLPETVPLSWPEGPYVDGSIVSDEGGDRLGERIATGSGLWPYTYAPNIVVGGYRSDHGNHPGAGTTTFLMPGYLSGRIAVEWDYAARIYGADTGDHAGREILVANVVDDPTRDDLILSAPEAGMGAGEVYLFKNFIWVGIGGDGPAPGLPAGRLLVQNRPNPFNPSTTIEYRLPGTAESALAVRLEILSVRGRRVRTLVARAEAPGTHRVVWDGRDDRGRVVGSGVYLCHLRAGAEGATRKMVLSR